MNNRVKELRESLGLTLEAFGKRVGVTKTAISRIEKGERKLTEQMLLAISKEFNINEEWLRTGNGEMKSEPTNDMEFADICFKIGVKDQKAKQAIINYWNLSESDRELFWKFIEQIMPSNTAEKEKTVEELENEYKKTVLNSVSETTSSALNTMPDAGLKNAMNK